MCISAVSNFLENHFAWQDMLTKRILFWEFPNCLAMMQSGKSGQLSASDVIGDHQVSFTMHLALRFNPAVM